MVIQVLTYAWQIMKNINSHILKMCGGTNTKTPDVPEGAFERLAGMAGRGSCRRFRPDPVPVTWVDCLAAVALSAPTKSDLQQRDIVVLRAADQRARLAELVSGQAWVAEAPVLIVFCGNNRRQRLLHDWHGAGFANNSS